MDSYEEEELFAEAANQASSDLLHAEAQAKGLETLRRQRLAQILTYVFQNKNKVPIVGDVYVAFQRILNKLLYWRITYNGD